jgi:hypothetical protein
MHRLAVPEPADAGQRVARSFSNESEGVMCLIAEVVHSCSNEKVAQAAVASIGREFAGKVKATASVYGMSMGAFTARTVIQFDRTCGGEEKQALRRIMQGTDQPILTALEHILKTVVERVARGQVSDA